MGGIRASAQMISYEIALGLSIIPVLMVFGELNLGRIVQEQSVNGWLLLPLWNENGSLFSSGYWATCGSQWLLWIPMVLAFIIFTISIFAETNRTPFDLAECETELVGGYHTEYSSMKFALFFLGEYAAMVIGSALIVTLFLGGWSLPFGWDAALITPNGGFPMWASILHMGVFLGKVIAFILFFILVRWSIPRFRYDQLMKLGWVIFFELALINIVLTALLIGKPALDKESPYGFWIALAGLALFSAFVFYLAKTVDSQIGPGKRLAPTPDPKVTKPVEAV